MFASPGLDQEQEWSTAALDGLHWQGGCCISSVLPRVGCLDAGTMVGHSWAMWPYPWHWCHWRDDSSWKLVTPSLLMLGPLQPPLPQLLCLLLWAPTQFLALSGGRLKFYVAWPWPQLTSLKLNQLWLIPPPHPHLYPLGLFRVLVLPYPAWVRAAINWVICCFSLATSFMGLAVTVALASTLSLFSQFSFLALNVATTAVHLTHLRYCTGTGWVTDTLPFFMEQVVPKVLLSLLVDNLPWSLELNLTKGPLPQA